MAKKTSDLRDVSWYLDHFMTIKIHRSTETSKGSFFFSVMVGIVPSEARFSNLLICCFLIFNFANFLMLSHFWKSVSLQVCQLLCLNDVAQLRKVWCCERSDGFCMLSLCFEKVRLLQVFLKSFKMLYDSLLLCNFCGHPIFRACLQKKRKQVFGNDRNKTRA